MQIHMAALAPPPVTADYVISESRFTEVTPVIDSKIRIVDLFAGCGGMGEGFTTFETQTGQRPFRMVASVEKDPAACRTLRLRGFYICFAHGVCPAEGRFTPVIRFSGGAGASSPQLGIGQV